MSATNPSATKIMLIRHAEKPESRPPRHGVNSKGVADVNSLRVKGWQRAGALAVFFAPSNGPHQNPAIATPNFIYAARVGKATTPPCAKKGSKSERPQETVTPLIKKLGDSVTVNFDFYKGCEEDVAAAALACAGVVLISWEHQNIPAIAKNIPVSQNNKTPVPSGWPDDRYDVVWVFDLDTAPDGNGYLFTEVPQLLLEGDKPI